MRVYDTKQWRSLRDYVLSNEPTCRDCQSRGIIVPANEVDHITPISHGGDPWDFENLQPLCKQCHSRKTAVDSGKREHVSGCDANGVPLDKKHHWNQ